MSPKRWKQPPRGVDDTSVLVAGVSGFRGEPTDNPSATLLAAWTDAPTFVWLLTEEILSEYVEVLERLRVRSARRIVALIREQGQVSFALSASCQICRIEMMRRSANALNRQTPTSS